MYDSTHFCFVGSTNAANRFAGGSGGFVSCNVAVTSLSSITLIVAGGGPSPTGMQVHLIFI